MWIIYLIITSVFHWLFVSGAVISEPTIKCPDFVNESKSIALICEAVCNNGSCQYSWTGFGLTSPISKNPLLLENVSRNHSNQPYTCTVKDLQNIAKTAQKLFQVYYGPDKVSVKAGSDVTIVEGEESESKNLICVPTGCNPTCNIFKWSRKTTITVSQSSKLFQTNKEITQSDAGTYTCEASNGKTESKQAVVVVTVHYAPKVVLNWNNNSNSLSCKATGNPRTYTFDSIKQYIGNTLVGSYPAAPTGDTATVSLGDKDYQDSGRYECEVNNNITNLTTGLLKQKDEVEINVEDLPVLLDSAESFYVSKGSPLPVEMILYSYPDVRSVSVPKDNMTINCNAPSGHVTLRCGASDVRVEFHNKKATTKGQRLTLNFKSITEDNFKTYTFYMHNDVGSISTNITIVPKGAPETPLKFYRSDISHDSVTFTLVTGFFNGGNQTFVVEHKLPGNQSSWSNSTSKYAGVEKNKQFILMVDGLSAETLYEFRAYAYNEFSHSAYTDVIEEKTMETPAPVALIVGLVVGVLVLAAVIAGAVIVIMKRRKPNTENDAGTYTSENKDLTLTMPTTSNYENHQHNSEYTAEPVTPDSPSKTIIYENTTLQTGHFTHEDRSNHAANYDVPRAHKLDINATVPYINVGSNRNSPYQNRDNKNAPYDVPQSQTTDIPERIGLYDSPRSRGAMGNKSNGGNQTEGSIPPYLELDNPDAVEEAYLNLNQSKQLLKQSSSKQRLNERDTVTDEEYLDMNLVTDIEKKSKKRTKATEVPYYNSQISETYENTNLASNKKSKSGMDVKDYQNVAGLKKENVMETKDYQNVEKYRKRPQKPSVKPQSDSYAAMDTGKNRKSVMSIPDYEAPPPPPVDGAPIEENYMNIQVIKSKR